MAVLPTAGTRHGAVREHTAYYRTAFNKSLLIKDQLRNLSRNLVVVKRTDLDGRCSARRLARQLE
jgi:hypothetical protein